MLKHALILTLLAGALLAGNTQASASPSRFCYDNTDKLVVKLRKVQLTTEQLKDVFAYQQAHRDLIAASHANGQGCSHHEHMEVLFEKQSIGVLTAEQFKKFKGRVRNETEALRTENYLLKKELARLKQEMEALRALIEAAQADDL
jgi:hypothetical protein